MWRVTEGELLAGRYELGHVLGRGGMGEVRAGRDRRLERAVAIKTLRPELARQPVVRQRFEREACSAARLVHPNVVAIHDVGEEKGVPYMVMEQVPGPTLDKEMLHGRLDPDRARRLGCEILAALAAAHAAGMVHRDVKPGNVLLAADGSAKVTDFGIAKATDNGHDNPADVATAEIDLTGPNQIVGTVAYMAPERVGGEPATVQSDLYSVGVILYEALSGRRPFAGQAPISLAWAIRETPPQPLGELCPDLDPALVAVIERAMARRPEDRFATAIEMAAALQAAGNQADEAGRSDSAPTVVARPATQILDAPLVSPAARPRRSRRAVLVGAIVGLALLGSMTAGVGNGDGDASPPTSSPAPSPAATEAPAPAGEIPAPLDDALKRLEEVVR